MVNASAANRDSFLKYAHLARGIGGALGAPIFLVATALYEKRTTGYVAYGGALQIQALPAFLLFRAVAGAAIGGIILAVATKLHRVRLVSLFYRLSRSKVGWRLSCSGIHRPGFRRRFI